jgi:hypothetical protein
VLNRLQEPNPHRLQSLVAVDVELEAGPSRLSLEPLVMLAQEAVPDDGVMGALVLSDEVSFWHGWNSVLRRFTKP